ncbi:MAG: hypothetical protein Q4B96_07480, partial [Bacillota bacterium]|nr:hypothetical protein [Bacillota bacterium]
MTMYSAAANRQDDKNAGLDELENLYQASVERLRAARARADKQAEQVGKAGDAANIAEREAANALKLYQDAAETINRIKTEEEDARTAAELTANMAAYAASMQLNENNNYSGSLRQALEALLSASSGAENVYVGKSRDRQLAEQEQERLKLTAATARLRAKLAALEQARAEAAQICVLSCARIRELEVKRSAGYLSEKKHAQNLLLLEGELQNAQQTLNEAINAAKDAEREEKNFRADVQARLSQKIAANKSRILPFDRNLAVAVEAEREHKQKHQLAIGKSEQAEQKYQQALEQLQKLRDDYAEQQLQHQQQLEAAHQQLIHCGDEYNERSKALYETLEQAQLLARQAADEAERTKQALIPLQQQQQQLQAEYDQALDINKEAGRMIAHAKAARLSMKSGAASVLSSAESALAETYESARAMAARIEEKIAAAASDYQAAEQTAAEAEAAAEQSRALVDKTEKQIIHNDADKATARQEAEQRLLELEAELQARQNRLTADINTIELNCQQLQDMAKAASDAAQTYVPAYEEATSIRLEAERKRDDAYAAIEKANRLIEDEATASIRAKERICRAAWDRQEILMAAYERLNTEKQLLQERLGQAQARRKAAVAALRQELKTIRQVPEQTLGTLAALAAQVYPDRDQVDELLRCNSYLSNTERLAGNDDDPRWREAAEKINATIADAHQAIDELRQFENAVLSGSAEQEGLQAINELRQTIDNADKSL